MNSIPDSRKILYFIISEYRPIPANQKFIHLAMATFAYPAGHILFHRKKYIAPLVTYVQQFQGNEFHHYGRTANHSYTLFNILNFLIQVIHLFR